MKDLCGRLLFTTDGNFDNVFTVSDMLIIAKQIFYLPANLIILFSEQFPQFITFFEIDCTTGTGWGAAIFSAFVWYVVLIIASVVGN